MESDLNLLPKRFGLSQLRFIALLIVLLAAGCGGLSSEPAIVRTAVLPTVTPTAPPDIGHPVQRVSLARGADIFNGPQGCQTCHGASGQGNGQVAANFACKIPNVADPAVARGVTITTWFGITTNGNGGDPSCLMPPWKNRLNEQQRWDVTSYLYSLHYTPTLLDSGAKVWTANCAACHGDKGAGDGPKAKDAARPVPNFTDPSYLISHSDTDLFNSVTHGVGAVMPAFDKLSEDERWAVVAYARSLSWEPVGQATPAATPAATQAATKAAIAPATAAPLPDTPTITVAGKVSNGTPGATVPNGLALTLHVLDLSGGGTQETASAKTSVNGDRYAFADVPRKVGQVYVVTADYAGVQQIAGPTRLQAGIGPALDMPLALYEVSSDPSHIQIEIEQFLVDFSGPTAAFIQQGLSISNTGQTIYASDQKDASGNRIALQVPLPKGATQIALDQSLQSQFSISSGDSPIIQSIQPLTPGENRPLQFTYSLSFTSQLTISQPTLYAVQSLTVYIPQRAGFVLSDKNYTLARPITLKDANNQDEIFDSYVYNGTLPTGSQVQFNASPQARVQNADAEQRRNTLAVVVIIAFLVFGLTGGAVWRLGRLDNPARPTVNQPPTTEALIAQIADLDTRFETGQIAQADYEAQRKQLKTALAQRIDKTSRQNK